MRSSRSCENLGGAPKEAGGNACPTWWDKPSLHGGTSTRRTVGQALAARWEKHSPHGGAGGFACRAIFSQLLRLGLVLGLLTSFPLAATIKLPASGYLAGPLDDAKSSLGDDINNYPFGHGFGAGQVHGWILVSFAAPTGTTAHFTLQWQTVGDSPTIAFANGAYFSGRAVANFESGVQLSQGDLDLNSGAITNLEVHAIFQNALIHKTSRDNRFPLASGGGRFTVLFGDYPPIVFPFPIPYPSPPTSQAVLFTLDANQNITGINFQGTTFVPITVVQEVALMPTYSFAQKGNTVIPGADGCLTGNSCFTDAMEPDGIISPSNGFLSPTLVMISQELKEIVPQPVIPPVRPGGGLLGAAGVAVADRLYVIGGFDGDKASSRADLFTPATNKWTSLPDAPRAVWSACAAAGGGKVYLIGGKDADGQPTSATNALDQGSLAWSTIFSLTPAYDSACISAGGRVFVFGGMGATGPTAVSAALDVTTGIWNSSIAPIPVPLAGAAVAVSGTDVYLVNGSIDGVTATNRTFVYSLSSGTWRETLPTNRAVYGASAAFLNGRLFVAGGRVAPGGAIDIGTVLFHSQSMQTLAQGQWYNGLYPPLPAGDAAGGVIGDNWYLVGGDTLSPPGHAATDVTQAFNLYQGWVISDTHPVFTGDQVRNAAGLGVGPNQLSPGAQASALGSHLASATLHATPVRFDGRYFTTDLPETLGGVHVTVDGVSAGIVAVAPNRIDFQTPFSLDASSTPRQVAVRISIDGAAVQAPAVMVPIVSAAPGIFNYSHGETAAINHLDQNAAIVHNADGRLNYPSQPAHPGDTITVRATGLGDVQARPEPFQRASRDALTNALQLPGALIDGKPAQVVAAYLMPGEAGVYEVKVVVPPDTRQGIRVSLTLSAGDIQSNATVLCIE
jgi:uncharacterized protein (TIGR03437 family)